MRHQADVVELPEEASYVVVGAGAVGCATAAALIDAGYSDVLILEANPDIAQGTSSMGAGMFGLLRGDRDRVLRDVDGLEVIRELERGDVRPGWETTGSFRLAASEGGIEGLQRLLDIARSAGVRAELVGPADVRAAWTMLDLPSTTLALHVPDDGQLRPHMLAAALRDRATKGGAAFVADARVTHIITGGEGGVRAVATTRGTITTRCVINAAGASAAGIARMVGLDLPIVPVRHSYFVTAPLVAASNALPHLRFTEEGVYVRTRDGGVMVGGWDRPGHGVALDPRAAAPGATIAFPKVPWEAYHSFTRSIAHLMPGIVQWPRQGYARGWPTFTPDGQHIVGESGRVPGFVMAAGCNAHGIAGAPALGRLVVESLRGASSPYLQRLHPDRFSGRISWERAITQARAHSETYNVVRAHAA